MAPSSNLHRLHFKGKVVVLTGASSGLGRAAALRFAQEGCRLVLSARNLEGLDETARQCRSHGSEAIVVEADVREEHQVQQILERALDTFERVDVWINNAGTTLFAPLTVGTFDAHRQVIETNLFGAMHGARAIVPVFRKQKRGTLINVGSVLSSVGHPFVQAYVISKFGVHGLSEALRVELAEFPDIHVCTLLPYAIRTPHFENAANLMGQKPHPLSPAQDVDEVARALVQLTKRPRRLRHVPRIAALGLALHACLPRAVERTLLEALTLWHVRERMPPTDGTLNRPSAGSGAAQGHQEPLVSTPRLLSWAAGRILYYTLTGLRRHA